jgi:hypothetical protein
MRKASLIASAVTLALGLAPIGAFAATAKTDVTEEDVMNLLVESEAASFDRGGGGM